MAEKVYVAKESTSLAIQRDTRAILAAMQESSPDSGLLHYKLFGEDSYAFQDKEIWRAICMSSAAANDRDIHAEALEEMLTTFSAEHTGRWMLLVYGMDAAELNGLATMAAVAASGTAMAAVAGNALLMHAIKNSPTAMHAIGKSQTAMDAIANSTTAMDAIAKSQTAMDAIAKSPTAMDAIAASQTAMDAIAKSPMAMDAVAASAVARNAIAASPYYDATIKERDMAIAKLVVGFANLEAAGFSGCAAMVGDSTAMTAVAASSTAMTAVAASSTAMNAVAASSIAMNAVAASGAALQAIAKAYGKTANMLQFLKAVNASDSMVKRIYSTLTNATTLFTAAQLGAQDGVAGANSWATTSAAPNAFLACACGYYNSGASVNVIYNGTVIAQNKTGASRPSSVENGNVNAITMAPSTFTENNDGYLAVQKFTAK